jgi:glutaredoxin
MRPRLGRSRRRRPRPERVVLVTRVGCHLCEQAQAIVSRVTTELAVGYREVDVDADPAMTAEFGDRVPVVLVDGTEHTYWHVDEGRLRRALAGRRGWL